MRFSYDVCIYSLIYLTHCKVHIINISLTEDSVIILTTMTIHECLQQSLHTEHGNFLVKTESSTNLLYKHKYL